VQIEALKKEEERYRDQYRAMKKTDMTNLRKELTEQRVEFSRVYKVNELQRAEIQDLKKELLKLRESLKKKADELTKL
jgi:Mg2+ and Co2+ transporter CorA